MGEKDEKVLYECDCFRVLRYWDEEGQTNLIVPPPVYDRYRAIIRGEPLILARGKLERHDRNINLLVSEVTSLSALARRAANEAEVRSALPRAHHFGHR